MKFFDKLISKIRRTAVQIVGEQTAWANPQNYKNATVREAVDAIARHAAKLKPVHLHNGEPVHDDIEYLLQVRPNAAMSSFDMHYKLFTQTLLKNNGFLYLDWRGGRLAGIYPVDYSSVTAEEDSSTGALLLHFQLVSGRELWADYENTIHIRRFYAERPMLGSDNDALGAAVEMVNASNAGMISAVKNGSTLRGILKVTKKVLDPKEVLKRRNEFVRDYADPTNGSGIAGLDADMEYTPLDPSKLYTVKAEERRQIKEEIHSYFGINDKIVRSTYGEDDWNALYESILEIFAIQMSLESTAKIFTRRMYANGHEIAYEANRLQYASAKTKIELVKTLGMLGTITKNEVREVFNMPKIEGGDELIENWNHTNEPNTSGQK